MSAGGKTKVILKVWKKYCSVSSFKARACVEAQAALAVLPILSSVASISAATGDNFISNLQQLTSTSESPEAVQQMLALQLLSLPSLNPWQRPTPTMATAPDRSQLRPWSHRWRLQLPCLSLPAVRCPPTPWVSAGTAGACGYIDIGVFF